MRLAATEDRLEADLAAGGEPTSGGTAGGHPVAELEELTAAHPLRELLWTLLVTALHDAGRQAEALAAYERYREQLAGEFGADPGPELRGAHLAVLRDQRPPPRSGRRGSLPAPLTSFVGRDRERRLIRERLGEYRLVTLLGPGGVGKTRLATTVAVDLADHVPGGCGWWSSLR